MFQLTTSRRGRHTPGRSFFSPTTSFNSRPHEEVDWSSFNALPMAEKFQLTTSRRGRLISCTSKSVSYGVSTHDLTKRSTKPALIGIPPFARFNSRPHEEVDAMRIKYTKETISFQLTTSQRGRLISLDSDVISMAFQLTTSRRGRHRKGLLSRGGCCFNSRPHEEVDCCWKM